MPAKIRIQVETATAVLAIDRLTAAVEVMEARIRRAGAAAADAFRRVTPPGGVPNIPGFPQARPGSAPPFLPGRAPTDWKMAGLGALAGIFSPFAGARLLNQAFGGGGGGRGGGGGGLLGGGAARYGEFFIGLQVATRVLQAEFEALSHAIAQSSKLFLDSHLAGRSSGTLFALQAAGLSAGISPDQMTKLAAQQNLSVKGRTLGVSGQLLRASTGLGDSELGTKILQNRKTIDAVYLDFQKFSDSLNEPVRNLYELGVVSANLKTVFEGLKISAFGELAPTFTFIGAGLQKFGLSMANIARAATSTAFNQIGIGTGSLIGNLLTNTGFLNKILPKLFPEPGKEKLPIGQSPSRPESAWERMGLIIHGGLGGVDYARQTAENTKAMADFFRGKGDYAVPRGGSTGVNMNIY